MSSTPLSAAGELTRTSTPALYFGGSNAKLPSATAYRVLSGAGALALAAVGGATAHDVSAVRSAQISPQNTAAVSSSVLYSLNWVPGSTTASGTQLASFFLAKPLADRVAVFSILEKIRNYFSDVLESIEIEHSYDFDKDRNQLFISVETGLPVSEIIERRQKFDLAVLSDDAMRTASKYTITTFF